MPEPSSSTDRPCKTGLLAVVGWTLLGIASLPLATLPVVLAIRMFQQRMAPPPWLYTLLFTGVPIGLAAWTQAAIVWRAWLDAEPAPVLFVLRGRLLRSLFLTAATGIAIYAFQTGEPRAYLTAGFLLFLYVRLFIFPQQSADI